MAELNDYSGPFKADFKPQYLSKDALTRMWEAASFMYLKMDQIWFQQMVERFGEEFAWELSHKAWSKAAVAESKRCAEALNIRGTDVAACMKLFQVAPAWAGYLDFDCELINNNHGIVTVNRCPALDVFEKQNSEERIKLVCQKLELDFM
ncbi:MAG: DUF6125 family protein [Dehalococcoidia bacterium]|nr:DUF6125 family protein [Dehalococcoidia bacterium]